MYKRQDRTVAGAQAAALAFVRNDVVQQVGTDAGRTFLVFNMGLVFVAEVVNSAQYGIGSRLAQAAKSRQFNIIGQILEEIEIAARPLDVYKRQSHGGEPDVIPAR